MARGKTIPPGDLEKAVMRVIGRELKAAKVSHRAFAPLVGISNSHLSRQIKGLAPVTVTELDLMCQELGLAMSRVVRTAEVELESIEPLAPEDEAGHLVRRLPRASKPSIVRPVDAPEARD
jgi:hypothetical protein